MSDKAYDLCGKLFPTTSVGSLPQTPEMRKFRADVRKGKLTPTEIEAQEFDWIRRNLQDQLRWGLDVLVDGEPYREDMVAYFARMWAGFKPGGFVRSYGNRYYRKPVVIDELHWSPATVKYWKYAQSLVPGHLVKGMVTGGYTVMDWSFNEHYPNRRATSLALSEVVRQEVQALADAGARVIQIDEPAISVRPDELDVAIESMEIMTDIRQKDVYFISHICYGEFDKIYPMILDLPVDQLDLEVANSAFDLFKMFDRYPYTRDIGLGVFDVHRHYVRSQEEMSGAIKAACEYLRPDQIWVDPDCGMKTRTVEENEQLMLNMVAAAEVEREAFAR